MRAPDGEESCVKNVLHVDGVFTPKTIKSYPATVTSGGSSGSSVVDSSQNNYRVLSPSGGTGTDNRAWGAGTITALDDGPA